MTLKSQTVTNGQRHGQLGKPCTSRRGPFWDQFRDPYRMIAGRLAKAPNVPRTRIERVVSGKRSMSPDPAFRLSRQFGPNPEFRPKLQRGYDLSVAARDRKLAQDREDTLPIRSEREAAPNTPPSRDWCRELRCAEPGGPASTDPTGRKGLRQHLRPVPR